MLYSAFILGLFGSVHCLAMCGPLVLAFGQTTKSQTNKLLQQLGRIMGYAILGAIMGLIGNSVALFDFQQKLSIIVGLIIIGFTVFSFFKKGASQLASGQYLTKLQSWAMQNTKSSKMRFLVLGLINSLLPCGLLYVALGVSVTMPDIAGSMSYMILFGLGTLPSMIGVLIFGNQLSQHFRKIQNKLIPVLSIVIGSMMVVRGLGLGIPYISPKYNIETETPECCKHKAEACENIDTED